MMRLNRVTAILLVFIAIAARPAMAQPAPVPQGLTDEAVPPSNDDFDSATVVTALPFDDMIDTRAATGAPDDLLCGSLCVSVWYRYTPDNATSIGATTWGSDYYPRIFVFTGERGALQFFWELNDASYRLALDAGTTYHFMVMNWPDLSGGLLKLSLTDRPPLSLTVVLDPVATMDRPTGVITVRGEITCSMPAQVGVNVGLTRYLAQRLLHAEGVISMACADRAPFEFSIQTYSASRFGEYYPPGQYVARVDASGIDDVRHEPAYAYLLNFPVLVRGAP